MEEEDPPKWAVQLMKSVDEINTKMTVNESYNKKNQEAFEQLDERVTTLEGTLPQINEQCSTAERKMTDELEYMKTKLRHFENREKKHNLILGNLAEEHDEKPEDTENAVTKLFQSKLNVTPKLVKCHRLGKFDNNTERQRVVMLVFDSLLDRDRILSKAHLLVESKCWITEDFSKETKRIQRKLLTLAKENYKDKKKFLKYEKIKIDGILYKLSHDEKTLIPVEPQSERARKMTTPKTRGSASDTTAYPACLRKASTIANGTQTDDSFTKLLVSSNEESSDLSTSIAATETQPSE